MPHSLRNISNATNFVHLLPAQFNYMYHISFVSRARFFCTPKRIVVFKVIYAQGIKFSWPTKLCPVSGRHAIFYVMYFPFSLVFSTHLQLTFKTETYLNGLSILGVLSSPTTYGQILQCTMHSDQEMSFCQQLKATDWFKFLTQAKLAAFLEAMLHKFMMKS